jgi:hypothetical protein
MREPFWIVLVTFLFNTVTGAEIVWMFDESASVGEPNFVNVKDMAMRAAKKIDLS